MIDTSVVGEIARTWPEVAVRWPEGTARSASPLTLQALGLHLYAAIGQCSA